MDYQRRIGIKSRHYDPPVTVEEQAAEWSKCEASPLYFIAAYCWLLNINEEAWIPFDLWPAQAWSIVQMHKHKLLVILKARQLGFTWLSLGFALWLMLFRSAAGVAIFSRIETDARDLLDKRLKGMYKRLPDFMKSESVIVDNTGEWRLSNGSFALAFATTGGRSYTFSFVLVDEADFQPSLGDLMAAIKPTINDGARMALLSTSDKKRPVSRFKQIYRAAKRGQNEWTPIFLPWYARPSRTQAWYDDQCREAESTTGSLDDVHQEYPATDTEALAPRTLDKRIPMPWIERCFSEHDGISLPKDAPSIPGLIVYCQPAPGEMYVVGVDPAEGNPTSDDSALTVQSVRTGEEVAMLAGKYQPAIIAAHADAIGQWFNRADVLVERNNHGHAVLLWLLDFSSLHVLDGYDDKPGWLSSTLGKTLLYDQLADAFRDKDTMLHSFETYTQLVSIEGSSLRAPDGLHDDLSDSYALAHVGRSLSIVARRSGDSVVVHDEAVSISPY